MKRQRRWHKGDSRKTKKTSQGFAVRTRKQNSDSTLLYGAVRTDAVITAKTKKLGSQGFWLSYKDGSKGQYSLYDPSEPMQ